MVFITAFFCGQVVIYPMWIGGIYIAYFVADF